MSYTLTIQYICHTQKNLPLSIGLNCFQKMKGYYLSNWPAPSDEWIASSSNVFDSQTVKLLYFNKSFSYSVTLLNIPGFRCGYLRMINIACKTNIRIIIKCYQYKPILMKVFELCHIERAATAGNILLWDKKRAKICSVC